MLKINIQLFAHKKGMGSTRNGRDSESKRLGAKRADGSCRQHPLQAAWNTHPSRQQRWQGL